MSKTVHPLAAMLMPLGIACGAVAVTVSGSDRALAGSVGDIPRCEIRVVRQGSVIELEGLVFAEAPLSGSYRLRVKQTGAGGSSDITQGGAFTVAPGGTSSPGTSLLGTVALPGTGSYSATLRVQWHGGAIDCHAGTLGLRRAAINAGEKP